MNVCGGEEGCMRQQYNKQSARSPTFRLPARGLQQEILNNYKLIVSLV